MFNCTKCYGSGNCSDLNSIDFMAGKFKFFMLTFYQSFSSTMKCNPDDVWIHQNFKTNFSCFSLDLFFVFSVVLAGFI